jgi:biopolymer transport protein ExbD/biopolymer transport protein TolR
MGFRRKVSESPRIDLTPMIDVVFLLLIFFMISTTFIERPGVTINLPEGGTQQIAAEKKEVEVYLTEEGDLYLQREAITLSALNSHLLSLGAETTKEMTFLLMADKSARHGWVIEVMEIARRNGFVRLAIATDKPIDETTIRNLEK